MKNCSEPSVLSVALVVSAAPFDSTPRLRRDVSLRAGWLIVGFCALGPGVLSSEAQVTAADYGRAQSLRKQYEAAAVFVPDKPTWVNGTHRFYYRRSLANGFEFVMVDADTREKSAAFDHPRLADSLSRASGVAYSGTRLPFQNFTFNETLSAIEMTIDGARWTCLLADYSCRTPELPPAGEIRRGITGPVRGDTSAATPRPRLSPDGKWMAFIDNYNIALRPFGGDKRMVLSTDGSEGNYYDAASLVWSPDLSERDGWNHLYLIDGATGAVKNQITKGAWPVRHVVKVDEEKRRLWFSAGGMETGKDPYFQHYYRINLDGSGLTPLTSVDANHTVEFSSDMQFYVDHYSRVDLASSLELRRLESEGLSPRGSSATTASASASISSYGTC